MKKKDTFSDAFPASRAGSDGVQRGVKGVKQKNKIKSRERPEKGSCALKRRLHKKMGL